jgi:tRNA-2-methylthio-N6-dimethylallyladenosine synthase
MDGQITEEEKSERLQRLQRAIDAAQTAFNRRCLHRSFAVLFERPGRHAGQLVGRSPYLQPVQVNAPAALIGTVAQVTIGEVGSNSLFGTLVDNRDRKPAQNVMQQPALAGAGA